MAARSSRTDDPRLGDSFAAPGTPTGAALVPAGEDGIFTDTVKSHSSRGIEKLQAVLTRS